MAGFRAPRFFDDAEPGRNMNSSVRNFNDFHRFIIALTNLGSCYCKKLSDLGDLFITICRQMSVPMSFIGSLLVTMLNDMIGVENYIDRINLIFFLYRITDLDKPTKRDHLLPKQLQETALHHPYLAIFLFLVEADSKANPIFGDLEHSFRIQSVTLQEKVFISFLLKGKYNELCLKTSMEIAACTLDYDDPNAKPLFDLSRHKEYLEACCSSYSALAKRMIPTVFPHPSKSAARLAPYTMAMLSGITTKACSSFPSFFQLSPPVMPPSDEEFQLLHPLLSEPLWMNGGSLFQPVEEREEENTLRDDGVHSLPRKSSSESDDSFKAPEEADAECLSEGFAEFNSEVFNGMGYVSTGPEFLSTLAELVVGLEMEEDGKTQ